jgi:uncharacterized protein YbaP (TraB family)
MNQAIPLRRLLFVLALIVGCAGASAEAASCVWKITSPSGGTAFLAGSIHALRTTDYPLPAAYQRAFDSSSRLVFETEPKSMEAASKGLEKAGHYGKGDSLKSHVDPRTYAYVKRYFSLIGVPEQKFNTYRPWLIAAMLEAAPKQNFMLGVERYLQTKAEAAHKPIESLETIQEHMAPFVGLNERESEALLLVHFINLGRTDLTHSDMMGPWRRGDADSLARQLHDVYRDFPAFADRLLGQRNRRWIPRIEGYMKSGQVYFVIAGAGHMGGSDGVVALLRSRGYTVEQL